ncbi:tetratricopeptide repeat protein [Acaryochloris sp. 'Moss Beach']|uniref:tetratricopeptide repeat protein n=1 Tax=Acaryochloris sp. 'Moss Beach' TaxID=2740837 RepID=UPI001F24434F|nr:tetratricopeptide repeat protein [Acaryochloris sp. 'Moss Beach']
MGREDLLTRLQNQLQNNERIGITGVKGMGGIGKTELTLQYAISSFNQQLYPGGVCWLQARGQEIATQIISFAKANLGIKPPDELEIDEQVAFTWQRWPEADTLIILDDVTDYDAVSSYLPPPSEKFKILITTRINLGSSVTQIEIEQLTDQAAIALLKSIVGSDRIESQLTFTEALCHKVGNLPLGLELLGRFLAKKKDWTIQKLAERLESKKLETKALKATELGMTAELGVAKALELSWIELNEVQQELACLLGMFAVAPIPWSLVENCLSEQDKDDLEDIRDEGLIDNSLLKRVEQDTYQLHQIVQEFFRVKLNEHSDDGQRLKEAFCNVMLDIAKGIDNRPTLDVIEKMRVSIPHLEEVVKVWVDHLNEDDLTMPYIGICRFYEGQGSYGLALPWMQLCLKQVVEKKGEENQDIATITLWVAHLYQNQGRYSEAEPLYVQALQMRQKLLGNEHPDVATSLNNLAALYYNQGRYTDAEPLYVQALEMRQKLLGNEHPYVAQSLNNLALLYQNQGRYTDAEPLYVQALEMKKKLLGNEHPSVATSLNNLAALYKNQGRYTDAEPLLVQALEMRQKLLGNEHPDVATSLNNLAELYYNQGRYTDAEPLYVQALEMTQKLLGNEHPSVALSLHNLAALYYNQGRYTEAEPLLVQALEMTQKLLGNEHPSVASSLNDLALLYKNQGRYTEAESLLVQALEMTQKLLGNEHPNVATSLNNLAELYQNQGRYSEAEPLYVQALEMTQKLLGNEHPSVALSLHNLAALYYNQGRYTEAEPLLVQALQMAQKLLGNEHPNTVTLKQNLDTLRQQMKD